MSKKKITKVFVYGTLKEGRPLDHRQFADLRTSVEEATIEGGIFNLGAYPTIKLDVEGVVIGEVHTFQEKDINGVINIMDQIEGYDPLYPDGGLYNRHEVKATLEDGEVVTAWAYEYKGAVDPKRRLEDGVWESGM